MRSIDKLSCCDVRCGVVDCSLFTWQTGANTRLKQPRWQGILFTVVITKLDCERFTVFLYDYCDLARKFKRRMAGFVFWMHGMSVDSVDLKSTSFIDGILSSIMYVPFGYVFLRMPILHCAKPRCRPVHEIVFSDIVHQHFLQRIGAELFRKPLFIDSLK